MPGSRVLPAPPAASAAKDLGATHAASTVVRMVVAPLVSAPRADGEKLAARISPTK